MKRGSASLVRAPEAQVGRASRVRHVLWIVLGLNLVAVIVKLVLWWWTGALSVAAEAGHSGLDAMNNLIALLFARVATRGPDDRHPYGHHKFETLGALVVVAFLSVTVFEIVKGSVARLFMDQVVALEVPVVAFVLLGSTMLFGAWVAWYETREGQRLDSDLLLADAAHTRADVLGTLAVIAGLAIATAGYPMADPIVALVLAGFITHSGWAIVKRSVPLLVDERAIEPRLVREVAEHTPGVERSYSVRSRGRTGEMFVELTISVDSSLDVERSHEIADLVEHAVSERFGARDVVVHVEPAE